MSDEATASVGMEATQATDQSLDQGGEQDHPEQGRVNQQRDPSQARKPETQEKKEEKKIWERKVNGKVKRYTEQELLDRASLADAAQERFQEAAKMRKQAEDFLGRIRDPENFLEALLDPSLGLSKEQVKARFEDWYAKEFIETENLTPEQKRVNELEAKLKKYAEMEEQQKIEKQRAYEESLTEQARQDYMTKIHEALDKGMLPKTEASIRRMAKWIKINHQNGFDAPLEVLVAQVRKERQRDLLSEVEAADGEVLIRMFEGTDVLKKLRAYDLEQLRKMRGQQSQPQRGSDIQDVTPQRKSKEPLRSSDVVARIRKLQATGNY